MQILDNRVRGGDIHLPPFLLSVVIGEMVAVKVTKKHGDFVWFLV